MNTTNTTAPSARPQCGYESTQRDDPPVPPSDSARIDHLLHTNDHPTQQEETAFRSFVADGEFFLSQLDIRIASVRALLLQLEATRNSLASTISSYKQPLHPIRRLPSEILGLIFSYGVGHDEPAERNLLKSPHSLDLQYPPWVYGRICRKWKDCLYEMPSLWTRVRLQFDKFELGSNQALLSVYLCRSKGLPLTVYLHIPKASAIDSFLGLFNHIFSHSWRWKVLLLSGESELSETVAISEDSFPSLEQIHIWDPRGSRYSAKGKRVFPNIQASKLRAWTSIGNTSSSSDPSIRMMLPTAMCTQITEYTTSSVVISDVIEVVQLLPHLRILSIGNLLSRARPKALPKAVYLPTLQKLYITQLNSSSSRTDIEALFDSMSCPALVHLSLDSNEECSDSFKRFEERSNFALQQFIIGRNAAAFVQGLQNCFALEKLGLEGSHTYETILDVLDFVYTLPASPADSPNAQFPNLRQIKFHLSAISFADLDAFMDKFHILMCVRASYADSMIVPLEIVITTPKEQASKMLNHERLKDIQQAPKVTVKIIAT
ncbi:hypothetical protein F5878DRAFT_624541 [Lentinula raphanica]|uniref:F-box domain-containing protein n=1 Tax=Lentinula raphanica TaxID=153919 RepID=A0AA38UBT4_9AGAR|nr:hypothetical protein F5878DRAFT_624541 [Lentinula raphanica]